MNGNERKQHLLLRKMMYLLRVTLRITKKLTLTNLSTESLCPSNAGLMDMSDQEPEVSYTIGNYCYCRLRVIVVWVDTLHLCSRLMTGKLGPDHLVTARTWSNPQRIPKYYFLNQGQP